SPAHGHLEIGIQRSIHRLEIDVAAEVAAEFDDHAAVHGGEVHVAVVVDLAESGADAAVHVGGVHAAAGGRAVDVHGAVHRADVDLHAFWHEHAELDADIVVADAAALAAAAVVAGRLFAPERAEEHVFAARADLLALD